jgi:hypothetical protein
MNQIKISLSSNLNFSFDKRCLELDQLIKPKSTPQLARKAQKLKQWIQMVLPNPSFLPYSIPYGGPTPA